MKKELLVNTETGAIRTYEEWREYFYDNDIHSYGFGWYDSPADVFLAMRMNGVIVRVSEA